MPALTTRPARRASTVSSFRPGPALVELGTLVRRDGPLSPERAMSLVRKAAHEAGSARAPRGKFVDEARSIPSLGAALFFALTGTPPSNATGRAPSLLSPHHVSPALDAIVRTCLALEPSDRFGSPRELAAALAAVSVGEGHSLPAG